MAKKKKLSKCPMCGRPMKIMPAEFELRAFTYRGGKNVGGVGFSITPEGMRIEKCYTNEGCGEQFFEMKTAKAMDDATAAVNKRHPGLVALLTAIRRETKVRRRTSGR
jgi:hypothetical protein